jgi:hypothetical protein
MQSIRRQLKQEGYSEAGQLSGGQVRKQLIALMAASRAARQRPDA